MNNTRQKIYKLTTITIRYILCQPQVPHAVSLLYACSTVLILTDYSFYSVIMHMHSNCLIRIDVSSSFSRGYNLVVPTLQATTPCVHEDQGIKRSV